MAPIQVRLNKVEGVKIDTGVNPDSVTFDVEVSMDEESRTNEELTVDFVITIGTKPSLVKFEVGGKAIVSGGRAAFDAVLEMDEKSKTPKILHVIYQQIFTSLYLISSQLEVPYPPPDLLHTPSEPSRTGTRGPPEDQLVAQQTSAQTV
jgi:hypothetical protein